MRAVHYETYGDAEVSQIGELDKRDCGQQVLIEVRPVEAHRRSAHRRSESRRTWGRLALSIAIL